MATGAGVASGGPLEATLDKKLRSLTNTMDSIQGLSTWCIDNKKYHSLIVRQWMKCLRKSASSHRLNLLYLANDVIQNCKRKNAIVYRTAFAEVLLDAVLLVSHDGDPKVIRSVERILSIWEEREVYSGTLITDLRNTLVKEESPEVTPVEQKTPVESKADLRSKVVAEFVPQALLDQLLNYKKSLDEVDLREKQLAAMRVDIFSSDALRRLKDKAGGKKFSRDFEEGSTQLREFVKFFEKQSKTGPELLEALANADIFYEMQYKEVKIVANAYQTFANRVSHLKRKLDALKADLPDLDESPIPSPSADAPSPTGSESPFHGVELAHPDPELDGSAMDDDAEPPAPSPLSSPGGSPKPTESVGQTDNREVEDMELSEEEIDSGGIIVEEQIQSVPAPEVLNQIPTKSEQPVVKEPSIHQVAPPVSGASPAVVPVAAVENVDLSKIGSILNSLNPVMKSTGVVLEDPPKALPPISSVRPKPVASLMAQDASSLVSLLSKVDVSPADLLSALSKVQSQSSVKGTGPIISANTVQNTSNAEETPPSHSSSVSAAPPNSASFPLATPVPSSLKSAVQQIPRAQSAPETCNKASALVQALHKDMDLTTEPEPSFSSTSLDSKIHSFLQGNPAFSTFDQNFSTTRESNFSPATGTDNQDGTPVRDEGGGTPTQDEMMDTASTVSKNSVLQNAVSAQHAVHLQTGVAQNGQIFQPFSQSGITQPPGHYQQAIVHPGERPPGGASRVDAVENFQVANKPNWFGESYQEGNSQPPSSFNALNSGGVQENNAAGLYPYQTKQEQQAQKFAPLQGSTAVPGYFRGPLPPVPKLPPPPPAFDFLPSTSVGPMNPPQKEPSKAAAGMIGDSPISGMVVHDHQHKPMLPPDDSQYDPNPPQHSDDFPPHHNDLQYQKELEPHHDSYRQHEPHFFQEEPYYPPEDQYFRQASPPHPHPRVRGHLTPPPSPSGDPYFPHDNQHQSHPGPLRYPPRRLPPPHVVRHPRLRPPLRPPHLPQHLNPRGPPRPPMFPGFHGPDPRLRGKRPIPRGGGPMFLPKRPFLPPRY